MPVHGACNVFSPFWMQSGTRYNREYPRRNAHRSGTSYSAGYGHILSPSPPSVSLHYLTNKLLSKVLLRRSRHCFPISSLCLSLSIRTLFDAAVDRAQLGGTESPTRRMTRDTWLLGTRANLTRDIDLRTHLQRLNGKVRRRVCGRLDRRRYVSNVDSQRAIRSWNFFSRDILQWLILSFFRCLYLFQLAFDENSRERVEYY